MAVPARNLAPYKGKMIQLIHIAKSKLKLDDATYRAILERKAGKTSSKDMSMSELEAVLEHLRGIDKAGLAFTPKPAAKAKAKRLADDPQSRKIRSLWLTLRDLGAIQDSSEQALGAFVKRQTKVESLEWLNNYQATLVIESLKRWVERVESAKPGGS